MNKKFIYYDIETGGLKNSSPILHIFAKCEDREFNCYGFPDADQEIEDGALKVNNLTPEKLSLLGAVSQQKLVSSFIEWVDSFEIGFDEFIGVGYGNESLDLRVLLCAAERNNVRPFMQRIIGNRSVDLLKEARKYLPRIIIPENYKLETVCKALSIDHVPHNAISDTLVLIPLHKILNEEAVI